MTATRATNSPGLMPMFATERLLARSTLAGHLLEHRDRSLAHVRHPLRLLDAQTCPGDPLAGPHEQHEGHQGAEHGDSRNPWERRLRWLEQLQPTALAACTRSWPGPPSSPAPWWGPSSSWRGRRRRERRGHDLGQQVRHTGERRRHARRVVGRGDRAEGLERREVGLGGGEADGLDVVALDGRHGRWSVLALPLSLPSDSTTSALLAAAGVKALTGRDHAVVERGVAVGHECG